MRSFTFGKKRWAGRLPLPHERTGGSAEPPGNTQARSAATNVRGAPTRISAADRMAFLMADRVALLMALLMAVLVTVSVGVTDRVADWVADRVAFRVAFRVTVLEATLQRHRGSGLQRVRESVRGSLSPRLPRGQRERQRSYGNCDGSDVHRPSSSHPRWQTVICVATWRLTTLRDPGRKASARGRAPGGATTDLLIAIVGSDAAS